VTSSTQDNMNCTIGDSRNKILEWQTRIMTPILEQAEAALDDVFPILVDALAEEWNKDIRVEQPLRDAQKEVARLEIKLSLMSLNKILPETFPAAEKISRELSSAVKRLNQTRIQFVNGRNEPHMKSMSTMR